MHRRLANGPELTPPCLVVTTALPVIRASFSASLGELLAQGKDNLQAPWLGLTAFFVIAAMLSLLIFVGEAVRDALDPRKSLV